MIGHFDGHTDVFWSLIQNAYLLFSVRILYVDFCALGYIYKEERAQRFGHYSNLYEELYSWHQFQEAFVTKLSISYNHLRVWTCTDT